ncbi:MAG: hypothetical protein MUC92_00615 [Fimbriimonadaceae bacterium]|jgi:hypothetical protein|nr:hypothetical protein [Fimbriimonadaceae bacterium]
MIPETSGPEGGGGFRPPRRRAGLEPPLVGRLIGENKRLIFGPPLWYDALCAGCLCFGLASFFWILFLVQTPFWIFSLMVLGAGIWAIASVERLFIDLRSGATLRFEGSGPFRSAVKGHLREIDALVLTTEIYPLSAIGQAVIYRLVLHWKGSVQPLLIVESERGHVGVGQALNSRAGRLYQKGIVYAKAMNLPFFDNSNHASPSPLSPF